MSRLSSKTFQVDDIASAIELCYENRWSDGLPVVPPTGPAIERVIDYLKRDPNEVIGIVPPRDGVATVEKVAINSVMGGCLPEHVPVVIAAIEAMLEKPFNLVGVQTTSHHCAPLTIVSGPVVRQLGFNTRECALGHGSRANGAIGRAIRLILWNIGGGYPGSPCLHTHGHPGYWSYCIAEDPEWNPWDPLHVERGLAPEQSAVTVVASEAPTCVETGAGYGSCEDTIYLIADSISRIAVSDSFQAGQKVLILAPMAAKKLAEGGYTKRSLQKVLKEMAGRSVRDMRKASWLPEYRTHQTSWVRIVDVKDDNAFVPFIRNPEDLIITVTGGWASPMAHSSLCRGWSGPAIPQTKPVRFP